MRRSHLKGGRVKNVAIGLLVGILATAGVALSSAPKSDADLFQEMRDRIDIEDLMWRYTRALDTNDAAAYAAAYTPDGQFTAGTNATKGREALTKMVADLKAGNDAAAAKGERRPPLYHMAANHRITFTGKDSARVEAYYITASAAGGPNAPLRVAAVGRSVDDLVRVNGQWLIKTRNVAPQN
jgi:uncharacterized protein (TIGR02246 family)